MSNKKYNQKHLTMTERIWIEKGLNEGESFASISRRIQKHPTTIAKEVKRNRFFPPLKERKSPLPCERKKECQIRFLCDNKDCIKLCKVCYTPGEMHSIAVTSVLIILSNTAPLFQKFIKQNPTIPVVEMDTVVGGVSNSTQVFLTMLFRNCSLMLIFPIREKSQYCVTEVFDYLSNSLGITTFKELFPMILTDNGTEFQFPARIECDEMGEIRTKVFFCNPNCSWQKGMIEKNHEYIRYVIPKGQSLDPYSWEDAVLLMNHINSEARDSLNGCNPFRLSLMLLNNKLHKLLGLKEIPTDEVCLRPTLLKK